MRLTNAQFEILRKRPQSTKLYLSIFQPTAIFKAQINNSASARGDRVITYDNVTLGTFGLIENGMTMWIGTTQGGMEVGKIRVRSATSTEITVSENANITWADNLYLTIFRYWELWPIYPRIIKNPNNENNVIFYKDYDIAYTNQNDILGTFVNAGPHRATWLDPASGQAQIYYSSSGSHNLLGNSLTYNWFFEGAMTTGSTSADPGYITYNTPGHYVTRLTINDSGGASDVTYRYVSIYNQANPPIQKWQLNSLDGSRDEGGYSASFKVFEIIPIQEHAVVVLFGENWYGDTKINMGGNHPNTGDIFFVGYVEKDSIEYDYEHSQMSFDASSLTAAMKETSGFAISVKSVKNPAKWFKLKDMDGRRALYHYLRWHTTALSLADFQFVGTDYKIQFFDSNRESMYDAVNNYLTSTLIGKFVSDRQGKGWMEVDAQAYPNPTGTFTPFMDITRRDWVGTPVLEEGLTDKVAYMEYGGVAYSGVETGTFNAYLSEAPGEAPGFYGSMENHEGLALLSQSQLNQLTGNVLANNNAPFPTVALDMGINASNLDIAPQEASELHIARQDTIRNLTIDGLYIPESISWKYDHENSILLPNIDYKQLVTGEPGVTLIIPPISDVGGGNGGIDLPPLPDIFPPSPLPLPENGDDAPARVLVHDPTAGLCYTQTFNTDNPTWYQVNGGLTTTQYQTINRVVICPNGAVYVGRIDNSGPDAFLARAPYVGGVFTIIEDQASIDVKTGAGGSYVVNFNCNPMVGESVVYVLGSGAEICYLYIGAGSTFAAGATFSYLGEEGDITFGANKWLLTGQLWNFGPTGRFFIISANAMTKISDGALDNYQNQLHVRAGTTGRTLHYRGAGNSLTLGTDNCATLVPNVAAGVIEMGGGRVDVLGADVTLTYLMGWGNGSRRIKSSDGGYSWSTMGNLPVLVDFYYCCVDAARWIAVGSYVYYSNDFGNTVWKNKQGNLASINPLFVLDVVKVVP